jgi:protein TonB
MNRTVIQSLDDIIFENRNKEYGSYRLRKRYFLWLGLSFFISLTFLTLCTVAYFYYLHSDRNGKVYLYGLPNPYLKSTEASILDPAELGSLISNLEIPENSKTENQITKEIDILHNFKVTEEATVDTFKPKTEEKLSSVESNIGLDMSTDSSVFGGYLLGEGQGQGTGSGLDRFPEFPGGTEAVRKYIELTVKYPIQAQKQKIHGRVIISFDVNKQGEVDNIKVENSIDPLLDAEAVKAVQSMPRWKPGMRHGKPVIVKFVIPVNFMPLS